MRASISVTLLGVLVVAACGDAPAEAEPPPEGEPPVARSAIALELPFRGEWYVTWGGAHRAVNHHVGAPSQRRAADILIADASGRTYRGDGARNEDYYAYGEPITAVADGVVSTLHDGVPDNVPGEKDPTIAHGNLVVVRHGDALYSAYAHLIPGSVQVRVGDAVKSGALLGLCGNSGNSSEPHLHFQLQDGPAFWGSWGVEAVFPEVLVKRGGQASESHGYTFLRADRVAPPSVTARVGN